MKYLLLHLIISFCWQNHKTIITKDHFPQPHFRDIAYYRKISYFREFVFCTISYISCIKIGRAYITRTTSACSFLWREQKTRFSRNFYIFKNQDGFNSKNNIIFHIMYLLQNYYDQHYSIATLIYWHHHRPLNKTWPLWQYWLFCIFPQPQY